MKTILLTATAAALLLTVTASDTVAPSTTSFENNDYLACNWYPLCGDPDFYSPVLAPKDAKTTTDPKDTKDEAVA